MRVLNRHNTGFDSIAPGQVGDVDVDNVAVKMWLRTGRFIPLDGSGSSTAPSARDVESLVERLADRDAIIRDGSAENDRLNARVSELREQLDDAERARLRAIDLERRRHDEDMLEASKKLAGAEAKLADATAKIVVLEADIANLLAAPADGEKPADGEASKPARSRRQG